ncbi:MAG: hypothetical protein QM754_13220 [Tepidisphaeraceae bacterium]
MAAQLRLILSCNFQRNSVTTRQVPATRRIVPEVETALEIAWQATLARPGVKLYDGPVCRFERWEVTDGRLVVDLSRTSYRVLVGTNFCHPEFVERFGYDVMANAIGVSTGLLTGDGHWIMGRRNNRVAYYPNRIHPFAGSIELADHIDLFANAEREIREEVHLKPDDIRGTRLVGLVEDTALKHPEAIFFARTPKSRDAVAAGLDADEHHDVWSVPNAPAAVGEALDHPELTPVAKAVLLLGGRSEFGQAWFDRHCVNQIAPG